MKNIRKITQHNWNKNVVRMAIIAGLLLTSQTQVWAGPPGPPGVPLDAGVSFLIAAAVGYGVKTMAGEK